MLFERQKQLLALLGSPGGRVGHLDFQKLLFLFTRDWEDQPSYDFVPYRYGGFSFTSYADKRKFTTKGLLEENDKVWLLTAEGRKIVALVPQATQKKMDRFAQRFKQLRGDDLIAESYRRYPWYATRSEVAIRILAGDEATLGAIHAVRPATGDSGVCTIGYEGRSLESCLNILLRNGVTLLCDVRRNPLGRKYGFSKTTLSNACESVDLRYEHLPMLGIESKYRKGLKTQADYDALFRFYKRDQLPQQSDQLELIQGWVEQGHRVALTCFEHLPEQCHRGCVAEALATRYGPGLAPTHM